MSFDFLLFFSKTIAIPIIEEESYEKNVVMYVKLGEPKHIAGNDKAWSSLVGGDEGSYLFKW